jgi:glycosyltransferase involved in cell wall biosynthesis
VKTAIVGPTHPYKGGVASHTTQTAHELRKAGHDVRLVSWSRLYPARLYPGEQAVPDGGPDLPPFQPTTRSLRWDRPWSWWRTGRSLRDQDLVVIVVVVPVQVPALLTLAKAVTGRRGRRGRAGRAGRGPRVVAIVHNVVPHETHPGGEWLMTRMLHGVDGVLVHSAEQAALARDHGASAVAVAQLAAHLPGGLPTPSGRAAALARPPRPPGVSLRVLALGMVRDYKGYDLLLEAARDVPELQLTIAGEQWGEAGERVRRLAFDPALAGRVTLRAGYVPGVEIPALLAGHDVLALPYRHATASQNVVLGHAYGMPVLATRVGTFPTDVRDGVDGLLVPAGDVPALTSALHRLVAPGALEALRAGVPELDLATPWADYLAALTSLASPALSASPTSSADRRAGNLHEDVGG